MSYYTSPLVRALPRMLPAGGTKKHTDAAEAAARFLITDAFSDPALWKTFVNQFREQPDSADLGWRGEFWGKMMRGAAQICDYAQEDAFYAVLKETVEDLLTVAEEDGRVSSYQRDRELDAWDIWGRKYVLLGMLHFYDICREEGLKAQILSFCQGCADAIMAKIGRGEGKTPITEASHCWLGVNSSSLLEPIVWLYRLTGEKRYLDFAEYIVEEGGGDGINIFKLALENTLPPYEYGTSKAYETISCFEGLLSLYGVTENAEYLTAAVNFGRGILATDFTVIGSCGCTHELFDFSTGRQTVPYDGIMQETCVTVTVMKFFARLLAYTGDTAFADAIEQSFHNAYLGALNTGHHVSDYIREKYTALGIRDINDTFLPFDSYSPLLAGKRGEKVGGNKIFSDGSYFGCCAAIGGAGLGTYLEHELLLDDGVNLLFYEAGEATFSFRGKKITLKTKTDYPRSGEIRLCIETEEALSFPLRLRIPAWSKNTKITSPFPYRMEDGYAVIDGTWEGKQEISLTLDFTLRTVRPISWEKATIYTDTSCWDKGYFGAHPVEVFHNEKDDHYRAIFCGPILLGADERTGKAPDSVFAFQEEKGAPKGEKLTSKEITSGVPCRVRWRFTSPSGETFDLVDYASAGRDWQSRIAAWLPSED